MALYFDYYGGQQIKFTTGSSRPDFAVEGLTVVIRPEWGQWNVVLSSTGVYAEPVDTADLEHGAQPESAVTLIERNSAALSTDTLSEAEMAQHLFMLGRLPLSKLASRGLGAQYIRLYNLPASVAIADGTDHLWVHTPLYGEEDAFSDQNTLATAQSSGKIVSLRFGRDGSFTPGLHTHNLEYGREDLAVAQVKFLLRHYKPAS